VVADYASAVEVAVGAQQSQVRLQVDRERMSVAGAAEVMNASVDVVVAVAVIPRLTKTPLAVLHLK
jgi:hypothetical protein